MSGEAGKARLSTSSNAADAAALAARAVKARKVQQEALADTGQTERGIEELTQFTPANEAERKALMRRAAEAPEIRELLFSVAKTYAGKSKSLEPEHLVLELLKARDVPVTDEQRAELETAAQRAASGEKGQSARLQRLLVMTVHRAGEGVPSLDAVDEVLRALPDSYAQTYQRIRNEAQVQRLANIQVQEVEQVRPLDAGKYPVFTSLGRDVVLAASERLFDRAVEQETVIERVMASIGKRDIASRVLIGEAGSGKTAVLYELVNREALGELPPGGLRNRFIATSATELRNRLQQDPKFLSKLAAETASAREQGVRLILLVDEAHELVCSGASCPTGPDLAEELKVYTAKGDGEHIQILGATTRKEYDESIGRNLALAHRLPALDVKTPSEDEALSMVLANLDLYADYHGVEITPAAAEMAVKLSPYHDKYVLPRGGTDFLDGAASMVRQQMDLRTDPPEIRQLKRNVQEVNTAISAARASSDPDAVETISKLEGRLRKMVDELEELEAHAAKERELILRLDEQLAELKVQEERIGAAGVDVDAQAEKVRGLRDEMAKTRGALNALPKRLFHLRVDAMAVATHVTRENPELTLDDIAAREAAKILDIDKALSSVIGQEAAKEVVARKLRLDVAGLRDPNSPIGVLLFLGPTGVGKSELSKAVAKAAFNGAEFAFDCNNCMEFHEVLRLFGAPPSYVGYEEGSLLAEEIRRKKRLVIRLDEIEKAHPVLWKRLMEIWDIGKMRDNQGNEVDARNVLWTMTSNLGAEELIELASRSVGPEYQAQAREIFERAFRELVHAPEVRERLEPVIFEPLTEEAAKVILDRKLQEFAHQVLEDNPKKLTVGYAEGVRDWLLREGFDKTRGARRLKKLIEVDIRDTLAKGLLQGDYKKRDAVMFDFKRGTNGDPELFIRPMTEAEQEAHRAVA